MAIICERLNLAYVAIPKIACTSLKVFFYQLNNHCKWPQHRITYAQVHGYPGYETRAFADADRVIARDYKLVAVVRDPVARIISAYTDKARRVVLEAKGHASALADVGLSIEPSPAEFADNIRLYCEICPVIDSHVRAYRSFLGDDLSIYDRIYRIEELGGFAHDVSQRIGEPLEMPKSNVAGAHAQEKPAFTVSDLAKLRDFCADDYALVGAHL